MERKEKFRMLNDIVNYNARESFDCDERIKGYQNEINELESRVTNTKSRKRNATKLMNKAVKQLESGAFVKELEESKINAINSLPSMLKIEDNE